MLNRREFLGLLGAVLTTACATRINTTRSPLLASAADWQRLNEARQHDADLDLLVSALLERARQDLKKPLLTRKLEGRRLLQVSRELLHRVLHWTMAYRLSGEAVYLQRVRSEMLAVCAFSDWNPAHFLDVAEMTTGLAIGYDGLYEELAIADRATIRAAIIEKGIAQTRHGHKTFRLNNNWGQVCIAGMVLGALAIEDDEPALTADVLAAARQNVSTALAAYAPDGVYPEGPAYWLYGTSYTVLLIAALKSKRGIDWQIPAARGFLQSADFYAHSIGPGGRHFNFADGNEGQELAAALFYLARETRQPGLLAAKRELIRKKQGLGERFAPLAALWWPADKGQPAPRFFTGQGAQPVAIWRSRWNDPDALWLAIKAGGAAHNHAHMDAGSFVLDWQGIRWARDLGMQDYNSLESRGIDLWNMRQDSPRWRVFRLSAQAHNTLTLDGKPHRAAAMASLVLPAADEALIDLSPVLLDGPGRITRRVRFGDQAIEITDEIAGIAPATAVRWTMTTEAQIRLDNQQAILSQKGHLLTILFSGSPGTLSITEIASPREDFDAPNPGCRQLHCTGRTDTRGNLTITTRFHCV